MPLFMLSSNCIKSATVDKLGMRERSFECICHTIFFPFLFKDPANLKDSAYNDMHLKQTHRFKQCPQPSLLTAECGHFTLQLSR